MSLKIHVVAGAVSATALMSSFEGSGVVGLVGVRVIFSCNSSAVSDLLASMDIDVSSST